MDTRGQGSGWGGGGDTPDPVGSAPAVPRLHDPGHRRPARTTTTGGCSRTRCARWRRPARTRWSTPARTAALGSSQGGGITHRGRRAGPRPGRGRPGRAVPVRLPARRRPSRTATPYREIGSYLKTHRGRTERGAAHARPTSTACTSPRAAGPRRCSRRRWRTRPARRPRCSRRSTPGPHEDKQIEVYDFNDHEGGGPFQEAATAALAALVRLTVHGRHWSMTTPSARSDQSVCSSVPGHSVVARFSGGPGRAHVRARGTRSRRLRHTFLGGARRVRGELPRPRRTGRGGERHRRRRDRGRPVGRLGRRGAHRAAGSATRSSTSGRRPRAPRRCARTSSPTAGCSTSTPRSPRTGRSSPRPARRASSYAICCRTARACPGCGSRTSLDELYDWELTTAPAGGDRALVGAGNAVRVPRADVRLPGR